MRKIRSRSPRRPRWQYRKRVVRNLELPEADDDEDDEIEAIIGPAERDGAIP